MPENSTERKETSNLRNKIKFMKYNTFYSNRMQCKIKQITKTTAKKLFLNGVEIFLNPANLNFNNELLVHPMPLKKDAYNYEKWDYILNDFMYYNCDAERGKYINFFVRVDDLKK